MVLSARGRRPMIAASPAAAIAIAAEFRVSLHNRADVIHPLFKVGDAGDPIRQPGAALVEQDQVIGRGEQDLVFAPGFPILISHGKSRRWRISSRASPT